MRADRVLALILIVVSLVAAVGAWVTKPARVSDGFTLSAASSLSGGKAEIAVFDLYGTIQDGPPDSGFGGDKGVNSTRLIPLLRQAEKDGVMAILLRVNSPGGTAAASQAIYQELMRIRKEGKIKIVAAFGDIAASGAYYIAAAADHIVALPSTTTGSIGVIAHLQNVAGLMTKVGISDNVFKSGPHKDIMSPFRPVQPDERAIIQGIVDDTYRQFLDAIVAGRPSLPLAKLKPLADGRIYTGTQAKKLALVDSLGNWSAAMATTAKLAGLKGEPTVKDYTTQTFLESVLKMESRFGGSFKIDLAPASLRVPTKLPLALLE